MHIAVIFIIICLFLGVIFDVSLLILPNDAMSSHFQVLMPPMINLINISKSDIFTPKAVFLHLNMS